MTTGQLIKQARQAADMTQSQLANKLGVPYQSISQWERDARNPRYETLVKIANALGTTVDEMIHGPLTEVKELDSALFSSDFPQLKATTEALRSWLEKIDSEMCIAKEMDVDKPKRTPDELQHMSDSIRQLLNERELSEQLARLEEVRQGQQAQLSFILDKLNNSGITKVIQYAESLSQVPAYQYKPTPSLKDQRKIVDVSSCELLDFLYEQARAQFERIKVLPYDREIRAEFLVYQLNTWPDVVQKIMETEVNSFLTAEKDDEEPWDNPYGPRGLDGYSTLDKLNQVSPYDYASDDY